MFYRFLGAGPDTVVVVHGLQGNNHNYLAPDLAALLPGHTLLFYDQRGGGRSDAVIGDSLPGILEHVADLEALRSALRLDSLRLLAHSGGGYIALHYALDHPEHVGRIALISPGAPRPEFAAETATAFYSRLDSANWAELTALSASLPVSASPAAACRELASVLLPNVYLADSAAVGRMQGDMCAAPEEALRTELQRREAFLESVRGRDWIPDMGRVRAPVLILHGAHDAIPRAAAEAWEAALPDGRLHVVEGADHFPWLDQSAEFARVVSAFLGEDGVR